MLGFVCMLGELRATVSSLCCWRLFFCNTRTEPVQIELQNVAVSEMLVPVSKMRFHACLVGTYCRTAQLCSDGPFYKQVCVSQHDANKVSKLNLAEFC